MSETLVGITLMGTDRESGTTEAITWDPNDIRDCAAAMDRVFSFLTALGNRAGISDDDALAIHAERRVIIETLPKLHTIERNSQILFFALPKMLEARTIADAEHPDDETQSDGGVSNHSAAHVLHTIIQKRFAGMMQLGLDEMQDSTCDDLRYLALPGDVIVLYNPSRFTEAQARQWATARSDHNGIIAGRNN